MASVRPKRESGVSQATQVADRLPIAWPPEGWVLQDRLFKLGVRYLAVRSRFSDAHETEKSKEPKKCCRDHYVSRIAVSSLRSARTLSVRKQRAGRESQCGAPLTAQIS